MVPFIDVNFSDAGCDRSIEGAVHHWVVRLEAMRFAIAGAVAAIARAGRKRTSVCLTITLDDGMFATAASTHADPFVAVADAFREVRRDLLAQGTGPTERYLAES